MNGIDLAMNQVAQMQRADVGEGDYGTSGQFRPAQDDRTVCSAEDKFLSGAVAILSRNPREGDHNPTN
jgi:hypothetical protein